MTWYIVRSATRREKRAIEALTEAGFTAYCPNVTRWERIGRRKLRDRRTAPLFPGYIFCQIPDGQFGAVEAVDGVSIVLRYMTAKGERSPRTTPLGLVEAIQIAELAGQFDRTRDPETEDGLKVGQAVKVLVGAWWGHIATITGLDPNGRVAVLHTIFGRDSPATYEPKQLERVADVAA